MVGVMATTTDGRGVSDAEWDGFVRASRAALDTFLKCPPEHRVEVALAVRVAMTDMFRRIFGVSP
jgi:hypothetical protein